MDTDLHSSTIYYTVGYNEDFINFMSAADVYKRTEYLRSYLKPGIRVLDMGSGPGQLSLWLAGLVAPGELHGIDIEPSQVEMARQAAVQSGCDNAVFQVADAADLPFEDGFFDLVHCHDLLAYIPDTMAVLREVKRVLKPGGIFGCREWNLESSFVFPEFGVLGKAVEVLVDLITADDGHPMIGRELKMHLLDAGFADVRVSGSFECYSEPEEIDRLYIVAKNWFLSLGITEPAKQYGAATDALFEAIEQAIEQWRQHPGSIVGVAMGEAVSVRP